MSSVCSAVLSPFQKALDGLDSCYFRIYRLGDRARQIAAHIAIIAPPVIVGYGMYCGILHASYSHPSGAALRASSLGMIAGLISFSYRYGWVTGCKRWPPPEAIKARLLQECANQELSSEYRKNTREMLLEWGVRVPGSLMASEEDVEMNPQHT